MGVISVECPNLRLTIKYITDTFLVSYLAPLPSCHLAPQTIPVILPTPQAHPPSPMVHSANQSLTVNLLVSPSPSEEREKMRAKCRWILTRYSECGVKIRIIPPNMDIYLFWGVRYYKQTNKLEPHTASIFLSNYTPIWNQLSVQQNKQWSVVLRKLLKK